MEKIKQVLSGVNPYSVGVGLMVASGMVAAQDAGGSIDVSSVVSTITGALSAIAAIGAAWVGFKYLKKVWNRL